MSLQLGNQYFCNKSFTDGMSLRLFRTPKSAYTLGSGWRLALSIRIRITLFSFRRIYSNFIFGERLIFIAKLVFRRQQYFGVDEEDLILTFKDFAKDSLIF